MQMTIGDLEVLCGVHARPDECKAESGFLATGSKWMQAGSET